MSIYPQTRPYCTYVTIYSGNKLPPFYIGSTSTERIENGYRGSVSSKKYKNIWNSELKINPQLFKTVVLTLHDDRKLATERELRFQKQLNVINHPMYINESYADKNFMYGKKKGVSPLKGRKMGKRSPESIQAIKDGISRNKDKPKSEKYIASRKEAGIRARGQKKTPCSDERKHNISKAKTGKPSPFKGMKQTDINPNYVPNKSMLGKKHKLESKIKMSVSRKGKPRSESHSKNHIQAVSGKNSNTAIKINIYNNKNELMFECHGNFDKLCIENNLPNSPLKYSYKNGGLPIYITKGKSTNRIVGWESYIGWYAKKI